MPKLVVEIPEKIEREIGKFPVDKSRFVAEAIEEKLSEIRLERSKAFKKLLLSVFNRMTKNSTLSDEDCLRLGREVNKKVAKGYGL